MRTSMLFVLLTGSIATGIALGADPLPPPPGIPPGYQGDPAPAQPPPPAPSKNDEATEPDVTITTRGTDRVEEYRYRGQLYMIKITPQHGTPYYLIDEEGRGQFRRSDLQPQTRPPMWVLKRF